MDEEERLLERLSKIEALFARAGGEGERVAAGAALARVRRRLADIQERGPAIGTPFSLANPWSPDLFLALCRGYGLSPYHLYRQWDASSREALINRSPWTDFTALTRLWCDTWMR